MACFVNPIGGGAKLTLVDAYSGYINRDTLLSTITNLKNAKVNWLYFESVFADGDSKMYAQSIAHIDAFINYINDCISADNYMRTFEVGNRNDRLVFQNTSGYIFIASNVTITIYALNI